MIRLLVIVSLLVGSVSAFAGGNAAVAESAWRMVGKVTNGKVEPKKDQGRSIEATKSRKALTVAEKDAWLENAKISDGFNKTNVLAKVKDSNSTDAVFTAEQIAKLNSYPFVRDDVDVQAFVRICGSEGMGAEANANALKIAENFNNFLTVERAGLAAKAGVDETDLALNTYGKMKAIEKVLDVTDEDAFERAANLSDSKCKLFPGTVASLGQVRALAKSL
jgi:hypothetical protein